MTEPFRLEEDDLDLDFKRFHRLRNGEKRAALVLLTRGKGVTCDPERLGLALSNTPAPAVPSSAGPAR